MAQQGGGPPRPMLGKLQKNPSLSALKLNEEKIASLDQVLSNVGVSQENIEFKKTEKEDTSPPEELLSHLNDFTVILKEPIICNGFRKYLSKTYATENLTFWKEIEHYKTLTEPLELRKKALDMYREFMTGNSENEVNLPYSLKKETQQKLSDPGFMPCINFFDSIQYEIYNLMKRDSFFGFMKDPIFDETKAILERVRCMSLTSKVEVEELSERDWKLILTEAKEVSLEPNEMIVQQNHKNTYLYQLKSGKLLVQKNISGSNITIATIEKEGTIFGEMSVLGKLGVATASIITATPVVVSRLEVPFIFALFLSDPALALRFYVNMGMKLAKLLQDISSITPSSSTPPKPEPVKEQTPQNPPPKSSPRPLVRMNTNTRIAKEVLTNQNREEIDRACHELFNLPLKELVVKEFICDYEKMISRRGTLFLSPHYICFFSKIFGQKTKEVIPLTKVTDVKKHDKKNTVLVIQLPKSKFKFAFKTVEELNTAQSIIQDFKKAIEGKELNDSNESLTHSSNSSFSSLDMSENNDNSASNNNLSIVPEKVDSLSLTPEDWEILLGNKKQSILSFTKGDVIIIEGQIYSMICQIISGTCRIEKQVPEQPDISIVLGKMKPGEIFGEITFLTEGPATASVYADDETVDMYFIDGKYVKETLVKSHPEVVVRFYNYLCINLAKRIAQREKEGWRKR